jgi:hypothetical protein
MAPRKRGSPVPGEQQRSALENARLARITGAAPVEMVVAAVASLPGSSSIDEAIDALSELRDPLRRLSTLDLRREGRLPAPLERNLRAASELARVRPERRDHEIRGRLLFREILGTRSFFQVAAWSIAGLELSKRDAELLEHLGVNTQLLDPHIWPLAVTRRVASQGAPLARSLVAGIAALLTPSITVEPVAGFMRFLGEAEEALSRGSALASFLEGALAGGRRIAGFGRPVLGPDERVPHAFRLARRFGRGGGPSVRLARAVERGLRKAKGLALNSAGLQAAIMRDMGFSPDAAAAFCAIYFVVPLLAHHAFAVEQSTATGGHFVIEGNGGPGLAKR